MKATGRKGYCMTIEFTYYIQLWLRDKYQKFLEINIELPLVFIMIQK